MIYLLNRFSLKKNLDAMKNIIEEVSKEEKLDYTIEVNSEQTSTEDLVKKYKKEKVILIAVGGDGTMNRVLNAMDKSKNVLGFIPYGTGNDFYKTAKELLQKEINKIDLIKINEKYFMNTACFGIDADIGNHEDIIHSKWIPKKQRYNFSMVYHFLKYKPRKIKITWDKNKLEEETTTVVVCNGRYYGGGYKVGFTSNPQDGVMEVYSVRKMPKPIMARLIKGMKKGLHEHSKYTTKIMTDKVVLESDKEIESNIDGESLTSKKFEIQLIPKGLTIYYNQNLIDKIEEKARLL